MVTKNSYSALSGWQLIALASEVTDTQPLARRRLNEEYVLFRDSENNLCTLEDRCAHRRAPISLGTITSDGMIQCPYHGWTYAGQNGQCILIPNLSETETIPNYKVKSYMTQEEQGFVYVWHGDDKTPYTSAISVFSLETELKVQEEQSLITMALPHLIDLLLDSPSLLLSMKEVAMIDDHWMGEPRFDGRIFTIERAADWSRKAGRRQRVASDLPLILRVQFDIQLSLACIELIHENNMALVKIVLGCQGVSPSVSQLIWRYVKPLVNENKLSKADLTSYQQLNFTVANHIDPSALSQVKPYISSTLHKMIG